jgi:putative FmdB family regulatory protein
MPTYEYACSSCQHEWELEQSIKEDAITECPACRGPTAKRQISRGTGFILKGGGWYADLYSSSSNAKPDAKPADGKPSSDAGAAKSGGTTEGGASGGASDASSTSSTTSSPPKSSTAAAA